MFTSIFFGILLVFQTYLLFRYVNRTNRELARFLVLIREGDISNHYPEKIENTFKGLKDSFQSINDEFIAIKKSKEQRLNYLEIILNHNNTGIISFGAGGKIDIANRPAAKLLGFDEIHNIEELDRIKIGFAEFVKGLSPGESHPYKIFINGSLKIFLFQTTIVKMNKDEFSIISFQDIKAELDIRELDSFRKLVRVIAHEIMNSLTPITTLTKTIRNNIQDIDFADKGHGNESTNDIIESLDLIDDRAVGLSNFVDKYRKLTQLPEPQIGNIAVRDILHDAELLFEESFEKEDIDFKIKLENDNLKINADENMIKQVLINLIKNAVEAVHESKNPLIEVSANRTENDSVEICIKDNGCGIGDDEQEKIFQPFYTSKKSGSGIGLSISLQIIQLHGGKLALSSNPGKGSIFCITI